MDVNQPVSIESLILANHVESVNGLLYISGGGWTTHSRAVAVDAPPPVSHIGLALIVAVSWNETNRMHTLIIEFRDEDAQNVIGSITAQINVGRPPTMRPGTIQYPTIGLPMEIVFPHQGGYEIVAHIDGIEGNERRWAFQVQDNQQLGRAA